MTMDAPPMTPFQAGVADRFGVLPNFFCTAGAAPGLVDELWGFARSAYLDSALPSLFKERLFVQLSRFCEVRYCIVRHVGFLVGLGRPAGDPDAVPESVDDVMALLGRPMPDATQLAAALDRLVVGGAVSPLPEPGTQAEGDLFDALTVVFVEPARSDRAREAVRAAVGDRTFEMLVAYLAFVRTAHFWTETHPELAFEPDMLDLMEQRPDLQDMLLSPADAERVRAGGDLRRVLAELHQTEAARRESETRNRLIVQSWAQAMWETDAAGVVVADSPSWRAYTGQTLEEWLGYGWLDAIHPDDRAYAERKWRDAAAARSLVNAEFRLRSPDGGWRWTNVRAAPVLDDAGNIEKWAGINVDIDERKRTEAALRESEMLRLVALAGGRMGTWNWDLDARTCGGDAQFMALWGFPPSDDPRPLFAYTDRMTPVGAAQMEEIVTSAIAVGEEFDGPLEIVAGPRAGHWIRWRGRATAGSPRMLHGVTFDITEQKRAETALRESQERQAFLLELSDVLRRIADPVEIQDAATRMLGRQIKASRVFYVLVEEDEDTAIILANYTDGVPVRLGRYSLSAFSSHAAGEWRAGRTASTDDVDADLRWSEAERDAYASVSTRAGFGIPLIKAGRLVALLGVNQSTPRHWTDSERELAREVAERTWAAVERARAEDQRRRAEDLNALLVRFSDAVRDLIDPQAVAKVACTIIVEKIGAERAYWAEVDWTTREYVIGAAVHGDDVPVIAGRFPLDAWEPFTSLHLAGQPVVVNDTQADPRLPPAVKQGYTEIAVGADLAVPVLVDGRLRSTLAVNQRLARRWAPDEVALVFGIAGRCWSEVERARAEAALRESEERQAFLLRLSDGLRAQPDAAAVADFALRTLSDHLGLDRCHIARMSVPDDWAEYLYQVGNDRVPPMPAGVRISSFPEGLEASPDGSWVVDDLIGSVRSDTDRRNLRAMGQGALVAAFVRKGEKGEPVWVLSAVSADPRQWSAGEVTLIEETAERTWTAIERVNAERRVKESEERLLLLVAELQHRVRNILTVVRLTFSRTVENEGTREELAEHFLGRLGAMARTQVALTRHADRTANLEDMIRDELLSVGVRADDGPVTLAGPEVELDHKTAESLAMALHELTINALKYGALSAAGARLDVTWQLNTVEGNERSLDVIWEEQGVPAIAVRPARRGFGRELIEEALPYRLGAETRLEFRGGGVCCAISVPLGTESGAALP